MDTTAAGARTLEDRVLELERAIARLLASPPPTARWRNWPTLEELQENDLAMAVVGLVTLALIALLLVLLIRLAIHR